MWAAGAGSTSATSAELFSAEKKKSRLGEAGGPDAFQWYVDLIQRHRVSPSPAEAKSQSVNFDSGRVGLMPFGVYNSGATAQRIKDQFVWSAMPIPLDPKMKKRCCDRNSEGFVIPKTTQQKGTYQAALRYALSFYSDPVQKMVAEQRGTLPIMRKWIESKEYLSPPPLGLEIIPKTLNDKQMVLGDHQQRHKAFPDWNRAVRAELLKALNGENAAKPALQAAMDAGDRVLAVSS
jgi:ABC-type glycerol-3-phosphate transport system substrate-binding protein